MRIDTGNMMQGQFKTDVSDISALFTGQAEMQEGTGFIDVLGKVNEENFLVENDTNFLFTIEKTDHSADNILEASVMELPSDEHVVPGTDDVVPEEIQVAEQYPEKQSEVPAVTEENFLPMDEKFTIKGENDGAAVINRFETGTNRYFPKKTEKPDERYNAFYKAVYDSGAAAVMQTAAMEHSPPEAEVFSDVSEESEVFEAVSDIVSAAGIPAEQSMETADHVVYSEQRAVSEMKVRPEDNDQFITKAEPESNEKAGFSENEGSRGYIGSETAPQRNDTSFKAENSEIRAEAKVTEAPEMKVNSEIRAEAKVTEAPEIKVNPEIKAEAKVTEVPEMKVDPEIRAEAKVTEAPEMKVNSEIRAEAKTTEAPEMKENSEIRAEAKVTESPEIKVNPEIKAEAKITEVPEIKANPEIKAEAKITEAPEMKENSEIKAEAKVAETPKIKVNPEIRAEAKMTESPEIKANSEIKAEAKITEAPEMKADSEIKAEAKVTEAPEIKVNPEIKAEAKITEVPEIKDNPEIRAEAKITEAPEIKVNPEIKAEAKITEVPEIKENSEIKAEAKITEAPEIKVNPEIKEEAKVTEAPEMKVNSEIKAEAKITETPEIKANPEIKAEAKVTEAPEMKVNPEIKAEEKIAESPEIKVDPEIKAEAKITEAPEMKVNPEIKAEAKVTEAPETEIKPEIMTEAGKVFESENLKAEDRPVKETKTSVTAEIREKTDRTDAAEPKVQTGGSYSGSETDSDNETSPEGNGTHKTEAVRSEQTSSQVKNDENISDFEKLVQGAVTLTPFNFVNTDSMMSDHLAEKQIVHQTYRALDESIVKNRKHFVIRLNPEGLGEITVKLIKSESSILVKMIASDRKTAALLNRDLDVLESQLKVHNAEIETVEYRKPEGEMHDLTNMLDGGQEYRNSSEETGRRNGHARNTGFTDDDSEEDDKSVKIMPSLLGGTILNRFI